MGNNVYFKVGTREQYDALQTKDPYTLYWLTDEGSLYKGSSLYGRGVTGTGSLAGLAKLYSGTGENTDGTMTQAAITAALNSGGSVDPATPTTAGIVKLYDSLGSNTDGTINQSFITEEINGINDALDFLPPSLFLDRSAEVTAATNQEIQDAFDTGKQICIEGENGLVYLSTLYDEAINNPETGERTGSVRYFIFAEGKEFIYFLEIETDENNGFVSGA